MTLHHAARTLFGAVFGALAALAFLIAPACAADPVFPVNSRIGLVPPPGFTAATRFVGFENPQASAAILITAMPAEAYPQLERSFSDEALKQQRGLKVILREPITLKDGKGVFIAGPREASGQKLYEGVVIATAGGLATFISVQMLEASHATVTDAMLRDAFKTIAVRKEIPDAEKLSILPYKFNDLAGFRVLLTAADGSAILTEGPQEVIKNLEQPFVLVAVKLSEVPKPEDRDRFARNILSGAPGIKEMKVTRSEALRIGQAPAWEIMAVGKEIETGADVTAIQWLRFGDNGHLQILAIVRTPEWAATYPKLRTIRDNIDQK
ncbi:MAG TPA: hypothetical protein VK438_02895 [Xanthobacteraceae bacterium]|nr:hypothetical protein [Xanthobacteraceae bacterium]